MSGSQLIPTNTFATQSGNIALSLLDTNFSQVASFLNNPNNYTNYLVDSGGANAYVVTFPTGVIPSSYTAGLTVVMKVANANTGASTLNVNSLGTKNILNPDASSLSSGQLASGSLVMVVYDGTQFILLGGSATNTSTQSYNGFKNRIINGAMQFWQRGTSASLSNSYLYLTADRWETDMSSTAAATVSQSTSVPTATTQYSLKIQRTAASTSTGNIVAAQALETANSYDLAGSSITLSFWAKCGANYSATSSILGSFVFFGTGTDQSMNNMRSNAWTSQTNASQNNTVSTTWTRFTQTVSCPAGTTQVGLQFLYSPTGTAGADDSIFITGVQLEKGSTATSFDYRPYGTELALCQRYYFSQGGSAAYEMLGTGACNTTSSAIIIIPFEVKMRASPSLTSSGSFYIKNASANTNVSTTSLSLDTAGTQTASINASCGTVVAGNGTFLFAANDTTARVQWSAEL